MTSWDGEQLFQDNIASPCGLIAKSFFNDSYKLYKGENTDTNNRIDIDETGIAWPDDIGTKFKRQPGSKEK